MVQGTCGRQSKKRKRVKQIIAQCAELVDGKLSQGFFFEFNADNVITPTTVNLTTGYSTTILNVKWSEKENY